MKKTPKAIGIAIAGMLVAASLASCSSASNTGGGENGTNSASNKITFAVQPWMETKFNLKAAVSKFEKDNPGKTVNMIQYPDDTALPTYSLLWAQHQTDQDIVMTDGSSIPIQFVPKKEIIDFNKTDFFTGATAKDKFVSPTLKLNSLNGYQYAIPYGLEVYGISANLKYFKAAGLTDSAGQINPVQSWQDIYNDAEKLTERSGGKVTIPGMTIQWGPNAGSTMFGVLQAATGSMYGSDGKTPYFDKPQMRQVLQIWKKGVETGVFSTDTFTDKDAGRNAYDAGHAPMIYETVAHVAEAIPTIGKQNAVALAMPNSSTNGSYAFTASLVIPTASKNKTLALKFIKDALMSNVQLYGAQHWGKLPVIKQWSNEIKSPWKTTMSDMIKNSEPDPGIPGLDALSVYQQQNLQRYLLGQVDLNTFLTDLDAACVKAMTPGGLTP